MTDQEINIAIAEACGFEVFLSDLQSGLDIVKGGVRIPLPSYTTDLNAMHKAESKLIPSECIQYADWVSRITDTGGWHSFLQFQKINATARQRAEAFLRTLGKWKDLDTTTGTPSAK